MTSRQEVEAMDLFSSIGIQEIIMILVIALIFVGPEKIGEFGTNAGKMFNNLRKLSTDMTSTLKKELEEEKKAKEINPTSGTDTAISKQPGPPGEKTE
jgi:Sec-independent protein translocase protein TatA